MILNDNLLEKFITTFYGSGNFSGDYWFIGMEEGGGSTFERVQKRLDTWQRLGEEELVDLYDFHIGINYPDYFQNPIRLQRTWAQQARIILTSRENRPRLTMSKPTRGISLAARTARPVYWNCSRCHRPALVSEL